MSEEEDAGSSEGKEDFGSKEEKFHTVPLHFTAILIHLEKEQISVSSDGKVINHSFEINTPPPIC